ncbi:hypothetical protein I35_3227 [Burkholderia cenocepacia H111]|nr:hypothetical protein I35_3227 [Burkholderia cenocepacia H111]
MRQVPARRGPSWRCHACGTGRMPRVRRLRMRRFPIHSATRLHLPPPRSPRPFHPTNSADRRADRPRPDPAIGAGAAAPGPSDRPLRPVRHARSHLKRGFRRDVKVPATNEATNNPAGRARRSARGRHALASPCRTP